jgi:O-antigen/teichoic acid export membrane protein
VLGLSLEARWVARALAAPEFFESYKAVPLVSTGVTLYALFLVLVVVAGRIGRTELNFPVTAAAAAINVGLNLLLVPPHGLVGAGIALVGSYAAMLTLMYAVTHRLFPVPFEWGRLARIVVIAAGLFTIGELALPTSGVGGFVSRAALVPAFIVLLWSSRFFRAAELRALRAMVARLRSRERPSAETPQDLEALRSRTELMEDVHDA